MLTKAERTRLDGILELLVIDSYSANLDPTAIIWLAQKLRITDDELKRIYEHAIPKIEDEVLPPNPLAVNVNGQTHLVAFLESHGYRCFFCSAINPQADAARNHGRGHLER